MPKNILVIDDDEGVLGSICRILEGQDATLTCTTDPGEGIALATGGRFDVVLCDWKMPGLDGMAVVEEIDRLAPATAIIMITGFATISSASEAVKKGAVDFLAKPFSPDELLDAIARAGRHKAEAEKRTMGKVAGVLESWKFPVPDLDDKAPRTIAETLASKVGVGKATSPWVSVLVLGVLAGAYIGFGGLLSTSVTFDLAARAGVGLTRFLAGTAFSLGLMLVVIAGAELFTGNNLMISSAMTKEITWTAMGRRWLLVYFANFAGSLLMAGLFYTSGLWKTGAGALGQAAVAIAYTKVNIPFGEALVRAIGCNWLVCLAVWMALASRQTIGKIFAIYFPIMGFVAMGFEHCVANMYFIPAGILLNDLGGVAAPAAFDPGSLTVGSFLLSNLVPVTIGNVIGGAVFVGMSYWGAYLRPSPTPRTRP